MTDVDTDTMADEAKGPKADVKMVQVLAYSLWMATVGKDIAKEPAARKAAWQAAKPDHMRNARMVLKRLSKKGYDLVGNGVEAEAEAETDA